MKASRLNRRNFLSTSGSLVAGGWLSRALPPIYATAQAACSKRDQEEVFVHLDSLGAADLAAMAEQILPSTETPGAREAGVIWFIDEALGGFMAAMAEPVNEGLRQLNTSLNDGVRFADLDWNQQKSALQAIETTPFFNMVHFLTVAGMFAMPSYGGNRDKLGWALLGFEDQHSWQPPFGYYDANYLPEVPS